MGLLFHLLAVVFNLISCLDDFVRPAVQLVRDDLLKVLQDTKNRAVNTSRQQQLFTFSLKAAPHTSGPLCQASVWMMFGSELMFLHLEVVGGASTYIALEQ